MLKIKAKIVAAVMVCAICAADLLTMIIGFRNNSEIVNAESDILTVKSTYTSKVVTQNEDISDLSEGVFDISAAKGETDGAQVIIKPSEKIASYDFEISDLTNGKGDMIDKSNVNVYTQIYTRVVNGTKDFPAGRYPDALIPVKYIKKAEENSIEKDANQGFWLDVTVPSDTAAGEYTGKATFLYDGKSKDIDIAVKVYDFSMPEAPTVDATYLIWDNWLIYGELDSTVEKWRDYFEFLLDYNVCGHNLPVELGDIEGFKAAVRKYYNRLNKFYIPWKVLGAGANQTIDGNLLKDYLIAIAEISVEDNVNYFEKAQTYIHTITDESTHDVFKDTRYPATLKLLDYYAKLKQEVVNTLVSDGVIESDSCEIAKSILAVSQLSTTPYHQPYADLGEDLFCASYRHYDTTDELSELKRLQDEGYTFYSYGAATTGLTGSWIINDYTISGRDVFWSKFAYNIRGDLFWNATGYCAWWQTNVAGGYGVLNDFYIQASHDGTTNGDGYMLYPGAIYGSDKPFPSIRLMQRRDGIDDYDYLSVLKSLYSDLADEYNTDVDINKAIQAVYDNIFSLSSSKLNYQGLVDMRDFIAKLIESAKGDSGFMIKNMELLQSGIELEVYSKKGYSLNINGKTYNGVDSGNGKKYSVTLPYSDIAIKIVGSGYEKEIKFAAGSAPETLYAFSDEAELKNISFAINGTQKAELSSEHSLSGQAVKLTLGGYSEYESHRPYAYFAVNGLVGLSYIEFSVYNPGNKDLVVEINARNSLDVEYGLDVITLKAGEWTPVKVGNFHKTGKSDSSLALVNAIGLKLVDNPLTDGAADQVTLFVDKIYKKAL